MQATGMEYEEEEGVDDECKFYILWNRITWLLLMNGRRTEYDYNNSPGGGFDREEVRQQSGSSTVILLI